MLYSRYVRPSVAVLTSSKFIAELFINPSLFLASRQMDVMKSTVKDRSRDGVVGIATGYRLERPRGQSLSPGRVRNFLHVV
jgi:hypothetical protein